MASFFRQTKDKYYIDEKGVFKKARLKGVAKNINFKAMHQINKIKGNASINSPKNDSYFRTKNESQSSCLYNRSENCHDSPKIKSAYTPKIDLPILQTSFNNFESPTLYNKSIIRDFSPKPRRIPNDDV